MTIEDEQRIIELIREQVSNLFASDRYTFQKNIQMMDGRNIQLGSATGTKIGLGVNSLTEGQKLGFFNATPTKQFPYNRGGNTGLVGGFTAGSGTAVKSDSVFNGTNAAGADAGGNAYSIGDIVTMLKFLGIFAA